MFIGDIKILPWFKATPPKPEKLERRERHCLEHGKFESVIVVDGAGNLIDGYTRNGNATDAESLKPVLQNPHGYDMKNTLSPYWTIKRFKK